LPHSGHPVEADSQTVHSLFNAFSFLFEVRLASHFLKIEQNLKIGNRSSFSNLSNHINYNYSVSAFDKAPLSHLQLFVK
jgi:hypothetical protein